MTTTRDTFRVGIDVGGTFTDFFLYSENGGAEAFNLDQEFQEGDPKDYKPVEYPPEIVESVAGFEKAFGMDRLIKASQNVDQEVEDAA